MTVNVQPLRDALERLSTGLYSAEKEPKNELLRDGVIQRFEYSHELALKFLRRVLEVVYGDDVDRMPYNDVLRTAAERSLIADIEPWFLYRAARNKTSHTYDAAVAAEVYAAASPFLADARHLLDRLHATIDHSSAA
jgi:nucleotidyltransferase substrate binding protein (TIGR01987 family)